MRTLKYQLTLLVTIILFSCDNGQNEIDLTTVLNKNNIKQPDTTQQTVEATPVDLKVIMNEFALGKEYYKANKKYVGQILQVKGRTSGVDEDGTLTMQVESGDEALWCYGLPSDFLLTINKNDIVEITGTFEREEAGMGITLSKLVDCVAFKKIERKK